MNTIRDLMDARIEARQELSEFLDEWMRLFTKPVTDLGLAMLMDGIPDDEKDRIRSEHPEVFEAFENYRDRIGGNRNGSERSVSY